MSSDKKLPILNIDAAEVAPHVLVVGDPARAEQAAHLLDEARQVGAHREYATFSGRLKGRRLTICSHGVGSAGAALCFEELARAGAQVIIRAGTCGAVQAGLADGDLVIATGAVRAEGLTPKLVPLGYPALAHHQVVAALARAAVQANARTQAGVVLTEDLFYPSTGLGYDWQVWQRSGVVAVEMELAALFIIAAMHGIRTGGILTVDGNPTQAAEDMSDYDPHRRVVVEGKARMLEIALAVLQGID